MRTSSVLTMLVFATATSTVEAVQLTVQPEGDGSGRRRTTTDPTETAMMNQKFDERKNELLAKMEKQGRGYSVDQAVWLRLTQELAKKNELPFPIDGDTVLRKGLNRWTRLLGKTLGGSRCGELGDGHFLRAYFPNCERRLSLDFYDKKADLKLNLDIPLRQASEDVMQAAGTMDLLVSHQVFEHLKNPSNGMAIQNAMLKREGKLVFSTPFVVQDHSFPNDYYRYTVQTVHKLLECGGFTIDELYGHGSEMISLAYLARIDSELIPDEDLDAKCDALKDNDCRDKYYSMVTAVARKTRDVNLDDVQDCFE